MVVTAGKADTASAIGALDAPHEGLFFAHAIHAVTVPQVDVFFHPLAVGRSGDEVEHLGAIRHEAHVVVKFIVGFDQGTDAVRDGVIGQGLQISNPMRIDRKIRLKCATDPRTIVFFAFLWRRMHGIVHEHDATAALGELVHFVPSLANHAGAVGIND